MKNLHSLLRRQIKRFKIDPDKLTEDVQKFLEAVNDAYKQSDSDRDMLERSLDLSSQELMQANSELRAVFMTFPDMFFRLDAEGRILDFKIGAYSDIYPPINKMIGKTIDQMPIVEVRDKFIEAVFLGFNNKKISGK